MVNMYDPHEVIQVAPGKRYKNKTAQYLIHTLRAYGSEFRGMLNKVAYISFGVGDHGHSVPDKYEHIYCLVDTYGKRRSGEYVNKEDALFSYSLFMNYIKKHKSYIKDYSFDDTHLQMIVLKIPNEFKNIVKKFLDGKYSEMYTDKQLSDGIITKTMSNINGVEKYTKTYSVVTKMELRQIQFQKQLEQDFGIDFKAVDDNRELDYPPILKQEVFNYYDNIFDE